MNVFIKQGENYSKPIEYTLRILAKNKGYALNFVGAAGEADLVVSDEVNSDINICTNFYSEIFEKNKFDHSLHFKKDTFIRNNDSSIDHLATAFYMINCLQEYENTIDNYDPIGRYKYSNSYQHKFNVIQENLVQDCFDKLCSENQKLSSLKSTNKKSEIFISHDIDTIHGALFQDGLWAIKNGRVDIVLKLLLNAIVLKPDWLNIDKIMSVNSAHELTSTFFWIATRKIGSNKIKNADYSIRKLSKKITHIKEKGFENGIHKSCLDRSFKEELNTLPFKTESNRYHFLKFNLPGAWKAISESGLKLDASLGFAEHFGFRNNYGLPFCPYNFKTQQAYAFTEVPLNIMDTTFHKYLKTKRELTADTIIGFIEKNKTNCILSLLWHNTYFTEYKYKGYFTEYKKIVRYLYDNDFKSTTTAKIISDYSI